MPLTARSDFLCTNIIKQATGNNNDHQVLCTISDHSGVRVVKHPLWYTFSYQIWDTLIWLAYIYHPKPLFIFIQMYFYRNLGREFKIIVDVIADYLNFIIHLCQLLKKELTHAHINYCHLQFTWTAVKKFQLKIQNGSLEIQF